MRFLLTLLGVGAVLVACNLSSGRPQPAPAPAPATRPATQPSTRPVNDNLPLHAFVVKKHFALTRLQLGLAGEDSGVYMVWTLPEKLDGPRSVLIEQENPAPVVQLYWGTDLEEFLTPRGSPRPPRPFEIARSGTLECRPAGPRRAIITLRDLCFETVRIPQIGPIEVDLDVPPPS